MEQTHPLAEHLNRTGEAQASFARRVEVSEPHLSLIINGKRGASLDLAARIEKITKGKVKAVELLKREVA